MRRLSTLQLMPGMKAARDIISYDKGLKVPAGTVLDDKLITRLDLYGILTVYVEEEITAVPSVSAPREPSYSDRVKHSDEFLIFKTQYDDEIETFREVINNVVKKNLKLDIGELLQSSLDMIAGAWGKIGILDMLQNMREYDDSTFAHCLNVGLICNIFAHWLKFDVKQTELTTACGLLHDVGKLLVPHSIITKPGRLSHKEFSEIKKHPVEGYQLLRTQRLDDHICNSALMHHERCDGSGYPFGLKENETDRYARIVAIADVYDAMTAARVYRGPLCPFQVIEVFEKEGLVKYDTEYLLVFLENVVNTYIMNRCRLSDGRVGDIIYINKDKLSRPIVQCGTQYVNLSKTPELTIECLL